MTRKLQFLKTVVLSVFLLGGANLAWADDWTLESESYGRTNLSESTYSWNSGWPKSASSTNNTFNCNITNTGMFVLQKYTVNNLSAVKELKLKLTGHKDFGADALAIWAYGKNDPWPESKNAAKVAAAVNTIVGVSLNTTTGTVNTPLVNTGTNRTDIDTDYRSFEYTISGDKLATLKSAANGNTFVLLITNKTEEITSGSNKERKFYSSGHSEQSYRPTLTVTYDAVGVSYGDGTMANYSTFETARNAVATAAKDATITVMEDQNITSRIEAIAGKTLNIVAGSDDIVLTNTSSNALTFLANASNAGTINVGNSEHRMIIKYSAATTNSVAEVQGNKETAIINLEKVTFKDITTSSTTGVIKANDTSGSDKITLKDVIFDGCTVSADNMGMVFCNANGLVKLQGNLTLTSCTGNAFYLKGSVKEDTFSPTAALNVYWATTKARGTAVVTNATAANLSKYVLTDTDWTLQNSEGSFVMAVSDAGAVAKVGDVNYESIEAAVTGAAENATIKILKDCKLTSRVLFDKNLTIEPNRADITVTIDGDVTGDYYALGLATASKTVTIGSSTYAMTIDGNKKTYGDRKLLEVGNGQVNLLNLTIKDAYTSTGQGIVCAKISGKVQLTDIAFNGCQSTNATTPCIVFNGGNDQIILSGNNTFTDCTADLSGTYTNCNIYLERRVKIDAGISNTTPIRLYAKESNIGLGNPVATQSLPADEARFFILNKDYACYSKSNGSSRADLTICEGKTLDVTAAEAATLVLPFAATIPEGVTCYTLTHTDGASSVVATEVTGGTLAAETPVLVNATMGSYKFRNSSKATTATSIPGSPSVSGALTGVYSDLTFTTENIASTYTNTYILNKKNGNVGFYKAAKDLKVGANRCYLTATNVPAAARGLEISFDDEVTGLNEVRGKMEEVRSDYFNLAGQRVAQPTKGLYIVNGKKVIVK